MATQKMIVNRDKLKEKINQESKNNELIKKKNIFTKNIYKNSKKVIKKPN
jgi:hypothetical protein